jgi:hypothetical protein
MRSHGLRTALGSGGLRLGARGSDPTLSSRAAGWPPSPRRFGRQREGNPVRREVKHVCSHSGRCVRPDYRDMGARPSSRRMAPSKMLPSGEARPICDVTLDGPRAGGGASLRAKQATSGLCMGGTARRPGRPGGRSSNEFCATAGYHWKSALRLLHGRRPGDAPPPPPGGHVWHAGDSGVDHDLGRRGLSLVRQAQGLSPPQAGGPAATMGVEPGRRDHAGDRTALSCWYQRMANDAGGRLGVAQMPGCRVEIR